MHRLPLAIVLVSSVAWAGVASSPGAPRLVLLYATCTVNKDFLQPYAPTVAYTPHLAAFARRSLVFTRHQTESPQSGIAFASIYSGMEADGHGIFTIPAPIADDVTLVAEVFRDAGFDTYGWISHAIASPTLGYAQGVPPSHRSGRLLRGTDPTLQTILRRLREDPAYRAFLVTGFTVTHGPYVGYDRQRFCETYPAECRGSPSPEAFDRLHGVFTQNYTSLAFDFEPTRRRLGLADAELPQLAAMAEISYKASVHYLDVLFGGVVDAVREAGLEEESAIVFTADHGEVLDRPNALFKWSHSLALAPEALAVPLIVAAPGAGIAPKRIDAVTRSIDVLPTLAALAGISPPGHLVGVDLTDLARTGRDPGLLAFGHTAVLPDPILEASRKWPVLHRAVPRKDPELMWVTVRQGDLVAKLRSLDGVRFVPTVFDLGRDPIEARDLYDPGDASQQALLERLRAYKARLVSAYRARTATPGSAVPVPEQADRLRSLGYIE